jgi:hypothetical protein
MATGASVALSFKLVLLTVVGLSERNNVRTLWRGAAKHHHHQASFNPVVSNESRLWVSLAPVFSHHHFRIKHDPRSQKGQTTLAYVGVVFDDVAREFHLEKYMHFCMHKSKESLYRCTKVDELQFTPLELTAALRHWCRQRAPRNGAEPVITGGGNALPPVPAVWWADAHHRVHYAQS